MHSCFVYTWHIKSSILIDTNIIHLRVNVNFICKKLYDLSRENI